MNNEFDPFENSITPVAQQPEVLSAIDENELSIPDDEDNMKKEAMRKAREALAYWWVDLSYIISNYKDAVENATVESFSWTLLKDHKTSVAALRQLTDLWKTANWMNKKEAQEIVFKPIFNKPPKLN